MNDQADTKSLSVGAWTKRCYFAGRALMDERLRPFDLGSTQWYVLWYLVNNGPSVQRDLGRALELERATLSGIIATLVRKDLVTQSANGGDQRQRLLALTAAGEALWRRLPDLSFIHDAAFVPRLVKAGAGRSPEPSTPAISRRYIDNHFRP